MGGEYGKAENRDRAGDPAELLKLVHGWESENDYDGKMRKTSGNGLMNSSPVTFRVSIGRNS